MICSKCKKRPAVLFVQRMENGKAVNEGLCWVCAKEAGLPQISQIMNQMGISEEEMEAMSQQFMELADGDSFEPGGAGTMPNFLQNLFVYMVISYQNTLSLQHSPQFHQYSCLSFLWP